MCTVRAGQYQAHGWGSSRPRYRPLIYGLYNPHGGGVCKARLENWLFNLFTFDIQPLPQTLILAPSLLSPLPRALCAQRTFLEEVRCARAPVAGGPPITALPLEAGRPQPMLRGSAPLGQDAVGPPTPPRAESKWRKPERHLLNRSPFLLYPFAAFPPLHSLVLDAPQAGWRRTETLFSSLRYFSFLRSEEAISLEVLRGDILP